MGTVPGKDVTILLHQFAEWLDGESLIRPPGDDDKRSHDDLVREFVEQRSPLASPVIIHGEVPPNVFAHVVIDKVDKGELDGYLSQISGRCMGRGIAVAFATLGQELEGKKQ